MSNALIHRHHPIGFVGHYYEVRLKIEETITKNNTLTHTIKNKSREIYLKFCDHDLGTMKYILIPLKSYYVTKLDSIYDMVKA